MADPQTGHPDFLSYPQWRSPNQFASYQVDVPTTGLDVGPLAVMQWQAVALRFKPSTGYGNVNLQWYSDAAGTELVGNDSWDVNTYTGIYVINPVEAMYAKVSVTNSSGLTLTAKSYLAGVNNSAGAIYYPIIHDDIAVYDRTLAAGGTDTWRLSWIHKGRVWVYFAPYTSAGKLSLTALTANADGSIAASLRNFGSPAAATDWTIGIPERPVEFTVANAATTAETYDLYVVAQVA